MKFPFIARAARKGWPLILSLLTGCAGTMTSVNPRDGQEQAVDVIWHDVYGRSDRPPMIHWREGAALTCIDPSSNKPGFHTPTGCFEGWTDTPFSTTVSWHGELSFSETALAHELEHVELLRRGVLLGHHDRPDFFTRIDTANAALIQAGL